MWIVDVWTGFPLVFCGVNITTCFLIYSPLLPDTQFKRTEHSDTMAVVTSMDGRAPVTVNGPWVACGDRNGWSVKVHKNDGHKYPKVALLQVCTRTC